MIVKNRFLVSVLSCWLVLDDELYNVVRMLIDSLLSYLILHCFFLLRLIR